LCGVFKVEGKCKFKTLNLCGILNFVKPTKLKKKETNKWMNRDPKKCRARPRLQKLRSLLKK
jgi:hypothetical protein